MKVYICKAKRSPIGSFMGALSSLSATELGRQVVEDILAGTGVEVDEVIMGCVLSAGLGQAPARQVAIKAGLPQTASAMTVNKVCSSGLKAVLLGADSIRLGRSNVVVCGGMESMSNSPRLLEREASKFGHIKAMDSMIVDGLWDVYNDFHMGEAAEMCADKYSFSREDQDNFALASYKKAQDNKEVFKKEITKIKISSRKGDTFVDEDEEPGKLDSSKVSKLRPAFRSDGTVTAANASSLNDGAAALLLASEEAVKKYSLTPMAEIVSEGYFSREPEWFTIAPVGAVQNALKNASLDVSDIDIFELNEAFSVVGLACTRDLEIDPAKVNIRGGSVAIGHPIGASGARILVTLVNAMEQEGLQYGACGICNGGGEASAMVIKRVS